MGLLTTADDAVFALFERVVDKWVFLTGKNNFKLAYIMLVLSSAAMTTGLLMFSEYMAAFFALLLNTEIARAWYNARKIQKLVEGSEMSGALPAEVRIMIDLGRADRLVTLAAPVIVLSLGGIASQDVKTGLALLCLGLLFYSAHMYIALTINPGGKSVLERVKEAIRNFGTSGSLQPVPVRN